MPVPKLRLELDREDDSLLFVRVPHACVLGVVPHADDEFETAKSWVVNFGQLARFGPTYPSPTFPLLFQSCTLFTWSLSESQMFRDILIWILHLHFQNEKFFFGRHDMREQSPVTENMVVPLTTQHRRTNSCGCQHHASPGKTRMSRIPLAPYT